MLLYLSEYYIIILKIMVIFFKNILNYIIIFKIMVIFFKNILNSCYTNLCNVWFNLN